MLILPMVNRRRVMNVQIKLKNAEKIRQGVSYDDALESEIIINRNKFSESSYSGSKDENAPVDFIRSKSIQTKNDFLVTTKTENDSNLYDVYRVGQPPEKVDKDLDKLYSKAITDMRKEIPGVKGRGRYVSFEDLGLEKHLTEDKIASLQRIVKEVRDTSMWPELFKKAGISELVGIVDYLNNYDFIVLSDNVIPEESLQDTLKAMEVIKTRDYKNLNKYYKTAKSNTDIYAKINYVNKIIYDKPLTLHQTIDKPKQLVKVKDEIYEGQKAA